MCDVRQRDAAGVFTVMTAFKFMNGAHGVLARAAQERYAAAAASVLRLREGPGCVWRVRATNVAEAMLQCSLNKSWSTTDRADSVRCSNAAFFCTALVLLVSYRR